MLAGFSLTPKLLEKEGVRILVLGTGAGLLPMFLRSQLGDKIKELVTVDINEEMVKVTSIHNLTNHIDCKGVLRLP
jgi:tRNA1(Val) A37 N6-methylase TrmN6